MALFNKAITSDADDGQDAGVSWNDRDTPYAHAAYFTIKETPGETWMGGLRFTGVTIDQGTTINSASITLQVQGQSGTATGIQLFGDDVDDAATFGASSRPQSGFTDTTGGTQQTTIPANGNTVVVDCTACVQDIINRGGWSNGNAMRFRLEMAATYASINFDDFETGGAPVEPELDIDYVDTSGTAVTATLEAVSVASFNPTLAIGGILSEQLFSSSGVAVSSETLDYFLSDGWNGTVTDSGTLTTDASGNFDLDGLAASAGTSWISIKNQGDDDIASIFPVTVT